MAFFNETHAARPSFFAGVWSVLSTIGTSINLAASSNARMRQVEHLKTLSDAELAEKGLRREDIVHYVFRDVMYL